MKLTLRKTLAAGVALTAALALAACSGGSGGTGANGKKDYVLGFNDALSGPIAFAGTTNLAGFETYIDYVNSQGGVNGHHIDIKSLDNRTDAATSLANFKQLASEGALAVFGNSASSAMIATAPLSESLKVPQMGLANADDFYTTYHPWVFKNSITEQQQVNLQGELITGTLYKDKSTSGLKVAVAATSTASGPPYTAGVKTLAAANGWQVVSEQEVAVGATDCSTQAGLIVSSGADIVLGDLNATGEDVVCMRALLARGFTGKFINQNSSQAEKTYQTLASPQWISMRINTWWQDATNPGTVALQKQAAQFGTASKLGDYSSDGYVSAILLVDALKACGDTCTGTAVRDNLEKLSNVDTNGIAGPKVGFTTGDLGHTFPQARFYQWDATKKQSVPISDWLDSGR